MPPRGRERPRQDENPVDQSGIRPQPQPQPQPEIVDESGIMVANPQVEESFLKRNPPTFNGRGSPEEAEQWLRTIERIFHFIRCGDRDRVACVMFQLTGEADYWWESVERTMTLEEKANITWEVFKVKFQEKYIPQTYIFQKETEFWNLRQGNKSVIEYDRLFDQLSRYSPHLVNTDEKKAERFRRGLRPEIAASLIGQGPLTYAQALNRALNIESVLPAPSVKSPTDRKRKWEDRQFEPNYGREKKQWQGNVAQEHESQQVKTDMLQQKPYCQNCKRNHYGVCKLGTKGCYTCGQTGHIARECPKNLQLSLVPQNQEGSSRSSQDKSGFAKQGTGEKQQGSQKQKQPQLARVYVLNKQQAEQDSENLAGMIQVFNTSVLALLNKGATHSIVSRHACAKLDLALEKNW